jgi:hypothetical protein
MSGLRPSISGAHVTRNSKAMTPQPPATRRTFTFTRTSVCPRSLVSFRFASFCSRPRQRIRSKWRTENSNLRSSQVVSATPREKLSRCRKRCSHLQEDTRRAIASRRASFASFPRRPCASPRLCRRSASPHRERCVPYLRYVLRTGTSVPVCTVPNLLRYPCSKPTQKVLFRT